jgi:hypothetical protein
LSRQAGSATSETTDEVTIWLAPSPGFLRYANKQAAECLHISLFTADRGCCLAHAWLYATMTDTDPKENEGLGDVFGAPMSHKGVQA